MSERNPDSAALKKFATEFLAAYHREHGFCPVCGWTLPPCTHVALMVELAQSPARG